MLSKSAWLATNLSGSQRDVRGSPGSMDVSVATPAPARSSQVVAMQSVGVSCREPRGSTSTCWFFEVHDRLARPNRSVADTSGFRLLLWRRVPPRRTREPSEPCHCLLPGCLVLDAHHRQDTSIVSLPFDLRQRVSPRRSDPLVTLVTIWTLGA